MSAIRNAINVINNTRNITAVESSINQVIDRIKDKFKYIDNLIKCIKNGDSENVSGDINSAKSVIYDITDMLTSINPDNCSSEEIDELDSLIVKLKETEKNVNTIKPVYRTIYITKVSSETDDANNIVNTSKDEGDNKQKVISKIININDLKDEKLNNQLIESIEDNKNIGKIIVKVNKKLNYANKLLTELNTGGSTNPADSKNLILTICKEVKEMLSNIKAPDNKVELINKLISEVESTEKAAEAFTIISSAPQSQQQPAAAYNNGYGFNIGNFIKPQAQQQPIPMQQQQPIPMQQQHQVKPTVFPHQICGLTQEQIAEEVGKHVKLIPKENRNYTIPADVLYDLVNNKLLSRKMKELDCKHRANNPYLTQVNINEYIGEPELLSQYPLCFTMPCNDKKKLIMVLFNPNPVMDKNGILQYPLHIFKATKTNNANK